MPIYEPGLSDLVAVRAADDCVKTTLKRPVLVDLRNIDTPQKARRHGLAHVAVGQG